MTPHNPIRLAFHCHPPMAGAWIAGFGEVTDIGPGQVLELIESLAAPSERMFLG